MNATSVYSLKDSRYWSMPRIMVNLALWAGMVALAKASGNGWMLAWAIVVIGAIAMHDLLAQGHEGIHGMIARRRWLNEGFTWLTHAVVGFSGTAYRAFHLDHHRYAQTERDPEYRLLNRLIRGAPGWTYLLTPVVFHLAINIYPMRTRGHRDAVPNTIRDLLAMIALHAGLMAWLGTSTYLWFVVTPLGTSFAAAMIIRSICEHHGTPSGNRWTNTRTTMTMPLVSLVWSNVNYHLEHHLFPFIPFHQLPRVRYLLAEEMARRGCITDVGYLATSGRLLGEPHHIAPAGAPAIPSVTSTGCMVRRNSVAFKTKVQWFEDILRSPQARRHLWSLYYAGEAYQELHPQGIFIKKLEPPFDRLLARHLHDEDYHAEIFRGLLQQEGAAGPTPLSAEQDVGWYLLTHILPDIVYKAAQTTTFNREETQRYMAFLHTLELRSISDLCALWVAARRRGETELARKVIRILRDERFHATYTHGIVFRLAKNAHEARAILQQVHKAEQRYYQRCLNQILRQFEQLGTMPHTVMGRLRWMLLKVLANIGGAVPRLPLYERMPASLMDGVVIQPVKP